MSAASRRAYVLWPRWPLYCQDAAAAAAAAAAVIDSAEVRWWPRTPRHDLKMDIGVATLWNLRTENVHFSCVFCILTRQTEQMSVTRL